MDLPKEQSQKKVVKKSSKLKSATTSLHEIKTKTSKRDQKKHRSVLQENKLPDGVELSYISKGTALLKGFTNGNGILCSCCHEVVSPTMFESHAGRPNSKKPYQHIFLSNGMSLHQYASSLKPNCPKNVENNDILCMVCQNSGDLVFCDGCYKFFHKECMYGAVITTKKCLCKVCSSSKERLVPEVNAVKDGTVSGADPEEQVAKQHIPVDNSCYLIACVICRSYEFSADGFDDLTSIVCDQCEKEYHIGCLKKYKNIVLEELPTGDWFCTEDCRILHSIIKYMINLGPLSAINYYMALGRDVDSIINLDVKWTVFKGKDASEENKLLLTQVVDILHDCFDPIIDSVTGEDFIPAMAYGRQMGSYNFSGVYSALLTINSQVITAGLFRVFGREFVELPLVATSKPNQGKRYFQIFLTCFERILSHLRVKKLVIPAAANAEDMWTNRFRFERVSPSSLAEYRQTHTSMVAFQGTTLLEKNVRQGIVTSLHSQQT